MQELKKEIEILLAEYFRAKYPEFPKGKLVPSESPDFIVNLKNAHHLGIELTRLNPANAPEKTTERKETIEFREAFIEGVRELFERQSEQKLFVKFLFSERYPLKPEAELQAMALCNRAIRNAASSEKRNGFFRTSVSKKDLPSGIDEVLIMHHHQLSESVWERSNNLGVSADVIDDLRKAIRKKDDKLRIYRKQHLDKYWLLITTDRLRGTKSINLPNQVMNHSFHSEFNQVLLFDLMKGKVYELIID